MRRTALAFTVAVALLLPAAITASAIGPGGWDHLGLGATAALASLNGAVYALNADAPGVLLVGGNFTLGRRQRERRPDRHVERRRVGRPGRDADLQRGRERDRLPRRQGLRGRHVRQRRRQCRRRLPRRLERQRMGAVLHVHDAGAGVRRQRPGAPDHRQHPVRRRRLRRTGRASRPRTTCSRAT